MSLIVLVDDEEELVRELKQMLEIQGHTVATATEGNEGLALILKTRPDLVILDLKMPGLSGLKILEQAKQHDPGLKVLMLTGYLDEDSQKQALQLGALAVLGKPIGFEEFEKAVQTALKR
ncbi:MAG: response regulator [Candidatus Omnitrophica bacterium]|nr:response regulator [Candidatus Omnitrophota bacterium]